MRRWVALLVLVSLGMTQGWSEEAAKQLVQEGILYGYPDGSLRLNKEITRDEVVALLWRLILQYRLKDLRELTQEDVEKLKELVQAVELWRKEALASQEAVGGLADSLKGLQAKLASLEAELSALAGKGVEGSQEALRQLQEVSARLSDLEGLVYKSLKDYREELNTFGEALRNVDVRLRDFGEALKTAREEDRRVLEEKWAGVNASLTQLSGKLASVEALGAKVGELERKVSFFTDRMDSVEAQVRALREDLSRLRGEVPKVRYPKAFGLGVYLTGLDSGFAIVEYTLRSGFSLRILGALGNPGPYVSAGVGYRFEGEGVGYRLGLGVGRGFYGPGFNYGEGSFGLKADLIGGLSLAVEGVQLYPFGSGPIVSRFGLGVVYQW